MEIRNEGETAGFFRLAAPLRAAMVKKNVQADLERLQDLLEGEPPG